MHSDLVDRHHAAFPDQRTPSYAAFAPGRINLIGEHTDYQDGFVMPVALPCCTAVTIAPRDDDQWVFHAADIHETYTASRALREADAPPRGDWRSYAFGVLCALQRFVQAPPAASLTISSTVPIGAGVSSSAALEVAVAMACNALSAAACDRSTLARLCRHAENHYAGMPCGIMDQFAVINGVAGHAMMLDCRSLDVQQVRIPPDVGIMAINTRVKHALVGSPYADRVRECETGVAALRARRSSIKALRDATPADLTAVQQDVDSVVFRRCEHVITENSRVARFSDALRDGDLATAGRLMYDSHASLRDRYEVSCIELDNVVETLRPVDGVWGARMTGGGFGGCVIALVRRGAMPAVRDAVVMRYDRSHAVPADVWGFEASRGAWVERLN